MGEAHNRISHQNRESKRNVHEKSNWSRENRTIKTSLPTNEGDILRRRHQDATRSTIDRTISTTRKKTRHEERGDRSGILQHLCYDGEVLDESVSRPKTRDHSTCHTWFSPQDMYQRQISQTR